DVCSSDLDQRSEAARGCQLGCNDRAERMPQQVHRRIQLQFLGKLLKYGRVAVHVVFQVCHGGGRAKTCQVGNDHRVVLQVRNDARQSVVVSAESVHRVDHSARRLLGQMGVDPNFSTVQMVGGD